jgi:hypothetical protein
MTPAIWLLGDVLIAGPGALYQAFAAGLDSFSTVGETLTALQNELPRLSTNSVHPTFAVSTHEDLIWRREHAEEVAAAIGDVVYAADCARLADIYLLSPAV